MKKIVNSKIIMPVLSLVLIAVMALSFSACGNDKSTPDSTEKAFTFEVVSLDGSKKVFELTSTEEMVGTALVAEGLIEGEEGPYGLEVHTVNGQKYTYDGDGVYWAFYIDGEYAMTGVDSTPITDGAIYNLTATKAE